MHVERNSPLELRTSVDVVKARQEVRNRSTAVGFSLVDQTKFVTAASEIAAIQSTMEAAALHALKQSPCRASVDFVSYLRIGRRALPTSNWSCKTATRRRRARHGFARL